MRVFEQRYCQTGTPLATHGGIPERHGVEEADFSQWRVKLKREAVEEILAEDGNKDGERAECLRSLSNTFFLCCPEDQQCEKGCQHKQEFCLACKVPICSSCQRLLQTNAIIPLGLANDNWYGYIAKWIYEVGVTWMEKQCPRHIGLASLCSLFQNKAGDDT